MRAERVERQHTEAQLNDNDLDKRQAIWQLDQPHGNLPAHSKFLAFWLPARVLSPHIFGGSTSNGEAQGEG